MSSAAVKLRNTVAAVASAGLLTVTIGTIPAAADTQISGTTLTAGTSTAGRTASQLGQGASYNIQFAAAKAVVRRVTKVNLNLRTGPSRSYRVIRVIRKGTVVRLLAGAARGGYVKVAVGSRRGWVAKRYLARTSSKPRATASAPSRASYGSTERRLTAKTIAVHRALRRAFPQIRTVYGYRPGSAGEHRLGRALDVMLPGNYRSAAARSLGKRIATWARSNAKKLNVYYVIWDQRIWNTQRSGDGWRLMRNGGSAAANHKNHVHISVKR